MKERVKEQTVKEQCRSKMLTKIFAFLKARYTILCARQLQPSPDDCAVRVQWFSSVVELSKDNPNKE